jgi:hypothetical protein
MQRRNLHHQQQQQQTSSSLHHASRTPTVISKGTTHTTSTSSTTQLPQQPQQTTTITQKQPLLHNIPSISKPHPHGPNSLNGSGTTGSTNGSLHHRNNGGSGGILRTWVLLLIIIVLTLIISLFPEQRQMMYNTEQQMEKVVYETEQQLERDVMDYWLSSKQFYTGDTSDTTTTNKIYEADIRMRQQSSKWVDDEKKLKQALQVLVERQARGLDLGVPVLTRYLGAQIPAFYSKDDASLNQGIATVEEWNTLVQEKYTEMRNEEIRWREIVSTTLLADRG